MLDAFMPQDGQSVVDMQAPAMRDAVLAAERSGAATLPPRAAEFFKVNEKDRAWVDAQCTPQPIQCFLQKLALTGARERIAKKAYIRAVAYPSPYFDAGLAGARARNWRTYEVPCGHNVMLTCRSGSPRYYRKWLDWNGAKVRRRGIADGIILRASAIRILPESWIMARGGWDGRVSGLLFRGGGSSLGQRASA